ncbi:MAG: hypothetical protein R3350_02225 [Saprospiraceae bacterium]|nr:hypothetical protein [Saprospiraceae bacterium]
MVTPCLLYRSIPSFLLCGLLLAGPGTTVADGQNAPEETAAFHFYSEEILLSSSVGLALPARPQVKEQAMISFYRKLTRSPYRPLLDFLMHKKEAFRLNDWLYYQLIEKAVDALYSEHDPLSRRLTCWFLLSESGYDTRLAYHHDEVDIYVYTENELYLVPFIRDGARLYAGLTYIGQAREAKSELYVLDFRRDHGGRPFDFYLERLPYLAPTILTDSLQWSLRDSTYRLDLNFDRTLIDILDRYPGIDERQYFRTPLSPTLEQSILPALKPLLEGKSDKESIQILLSFTRSAFEYREDEQQFGANRPLVPDELLYYPFSDCEDRAILFYKLVRHLLDLPMIVVAYPEHITIGVRFEGGEGKIFLHQGQKYYACDPTGPPGSDQIGILPAGYENMDYQVIEQHR